MMSDSSSIRGLYTICDNSFSPTHSHLDLARSFLSGGAKILQLRMKGASPNLVEKIASEILEEKTRFSFTFILNDFVDLAARLPVDGVHVGIDDLPVDEVRLRIGPKKWIGYSSHSIVEAKTAILQGADYVAFGAIFPTKTKGPGHPVQGLAKLEELVSEISVPIVAIGGINESNLESVLKTGVDAVAMITALTQASDITAKTRFFIERIKTNDSGAKTQTFENSVNRA